MSFLDDIDRAKWEGMRAHFAALPASSEEDWQERRAELIWREPSALCHAGEDRFSTRNYLALREVVGDDGRAMRFRAVDEFGRFYV